MFCTRAPGLFALSLTMVFTVAADNGATYQARVDALKKQITAIQKTIAERQSQQGSLSSELKKADQAIAAIAGRIRQAREDKRAANAALERLYEKESELHERLDVQRDLLNRQPLQ